MAHDPKQSNRPSRLGVSGAASALALPVAPVTPPGVARRPYVAPVVRRLGSVRELTQTNPSNGK